MKLAKQVSSLVLTGLCASIVNLNAQVSVPTTPSSVGQAKADLIKSAFSSYLSGDTNQSRQYLIRASELDVEDVEIDGVQYLTTSTENGEIYKCDEDGEIMEDEHGDFIICGYFKNGIANFI